MLVLLVPAAWAEDIFSCDFETQAQRDQWQLTFAFNAQMRKNFKNFWCIGEPGSYGPDSRYGMYMGLKDNDPEWHHDNSKGQTVVSVCSLPHMEPGVYTFTMDWIFKGVGGREGIYVCVYPDTALIASQPNGALSADARKWCLPLSSDSVVGGVMTWQVATANFTIRPGDEKVQWKLAVIALFKGGGAAPKPSPAVDNIRIFRREDCMPPVNVTHDSQDGDIVLSWEGNSDAYEVRNYNDHTGHWRVFPETTSKSIKISGVEEGVVSFYVRSRCGENYSEWVKYERFVFIKGNRCVEFLDLNDKTCAYGVFGNPTLNRGAVDNGYASEFSRHTIHFLDGEIDSRTMDGNGGGLRTKPEGALASVRLGNWRVGAESERLTYTYKVDDLSTAILELRYAIVEQIINHSTDAQAQFELEVLHNGKAISGGCGRAVFTTPNAETKDWSGWHTTDQTYWRDWTTVSINLREYVGETITIRLTTRDCSASGHYGYAYFVLDCNAGEMSGLNCGVDNPTTKFRAPDGFYYSWYKKADPSVILSTKQDFTIGPMDTTIYMLDVITKSNEQCYYTLTVRGWPRLPHPEAKVIDQKDPCSNTVRFANTSCVYVQNMITGEIGPSEEKLGSLRWDFGDGTDPIYSNSEMVYHDFPMEGGEFKVTLSGMVNGIDDECSVDTSFYVYLPNKVKKVVEENHVLCKERYPYGFKYAGKSYYYPNELDSLFTFTDRQGCDSLVHVQLSWTKAEQSATSDVICYGDTLVFGSQRLTQSGVYKETFQNQFGCDSVVTLTLDVLDKIDLEVEDTIRFCAEGDSLYIPFYLGTKQVKEITLSFDAASQLRGMDPVYRLQENTGGFMVPAPARPCRLHATLTAESSLHCPIPVREVWLDLPYATSVFTMNTAVIAVLDHTMNGGYRFTKVVWYRDGLPIDQITQMVYRTSLADLGHEFYAELTDDQGSVLSTCPIIYQADESAVGKTPVRGMDNTELALPIAVYDVLGKRVATLNSMEEVNTLGSGLYVLTDGTNAIKLFR